MGCKFILLVGNKIVSCKLLLLDDKFKEIFLSIASCIWRVENFKRLF